MIPPAKKKRTMKAKEPPPVARFEPGERVRVRYRGIEHVGTIQASELRRGAISYSIEWTAESTARDPALRGMKRVSDGDVVGVAGLAPTRELIDEGYAARMARRREP